MSPLKGVLKLDGKKYAEGTPREGVTLATDLCYSKRDGVQGFTSLKLFLEWADKEGVRQGIDECIKKTKTANQELKNLTASQKDKLFIGQTAKLKGVQDSIAKKLMTKRIEASDVKKLSELARKGEIGSIFLYDLINYQGSWIYLPGWEYGPFPLGFYPSLPGFNDRASSCYNPSNHWVVLYQHTWWRGWRLWVNPRTSFDNMGNWDMSNRVSSVIC